MATLQNDLSEFIGLLNSHEAEYVVVGGYAVAYHGYPRFTGNIDLFVRPSRENAERVLRALSAFGFADLELDGESLTREERVLQIGRPPNRIDLLTSISGVSFEEAWQSRVSGQLDTRQVYFLGWDALIKNKTVSDRDKDRLDVKKLHAIAERAKSS